jgi:hypothetical protein
MGNITRHIAKSPCSSKCVLCNWFLVAGQHLNDKETKTIIIIIIIIDSIAITIYLQNYIECSKSTDFMNQVQLLRPAVCCSEHISAF